MFVFIFTTVLIYGEFLAHSFPWLKLGCKVKDLKMTSDEFAAKVKEYHYHGKFIVKYEEETGLMLM